MIYFLYMEGECVSRGQGGVNRHINAIADLL